MLYRRDCHLVRILFLSGQSLNRRYYYCNGPNRRVPGFIWLQLFWFDVIFGLSILTWTDGKPYGDRHYCLNGLRHYSTKATQRAVFFWGSGLACLTANKGFSKPTALSYWAINLPRLLGITQQPLLVSSINLRTSCQITRGMSKIS